MPILKTPVSSEDHIQGDPDAPITLVEYGDYECSHCGAVYPVIKRVQKQLGKKLRFVFRNFPLSELHPHAEDAAEAAEFAGDHGLFWEMHDLIFENQDFLTRSLLLDLVKQIGLDPNGLEKAWEEETYLARVKKDFMGGVRSGVNGTPTLYINDHRYDGSFEFEDIIAAFKVHHPTR